MVGVPPSFPIPQETAIASYNYVDIASGEGVSSFKLSVGEDTEGKAFALLTNSLITAVNSGKITTNNVRYDFRTGDFLLPRQVQGTAFFSGYVDTNASGYILKATLYKEVGAISTDGLGDLIYSDTNLIVVNNSSSYVFKTFTLTNQYVNKVTMLCLTITDQLWTKVKFYYSDGSNAETTAEQSVLDGEGAITKSFTNPKKGSPIFKIELWGRTQGGSGSVDDMFIYEENTSGLTITALSSEITSPSITGENGILLKMPLTTTNIKKGERILLRVEPSGTGGLIVDPTQEHNTEQTAKIDIPFDIDL